MSQGSTRSSVVERTSQPISTHHSSSSSRDEVNTPPWAMMMEAIAKLQGKMEKMKKEKGNTAYNMQQGMSRSYGKHVNTATAADATLRSDTSEATHSHVVGRPLTTQTAESEHTDSTGSFFRF